MPDLLKILLVDDNPDDRLLIIRELRKLFLVDVDEVFDNKGFDRACKQADFDLVITDYQLRWTTGIEILIRIKTGFPQKPVIMFTGTGSEEIAVMAMKIGLDDYILKTPQHYIRLALSVKSIIKRMQDEFLRKQAENALHQSQEDYRSLVEKLGIGISIYDKDLHILVSNEAHATMFGTETSFMTGLKLSDLYCFPDTIESNLNSDFAHMADPRFEILAKGVRKDKSVFDVHIRIFPSYNGMGELSGYIEMAEDVTSKLRNEKAQQVLNNTSTAGFVSETLVQLTDSICYELASLVDCNGSRIHIYSEVGNSMRVFSCQLRETANFAMPDTAALVARTIDNGSVTFLMQDDIIQLSVTDSKIQHPGMMNSWLGIPLRTQGGVYGVLEFFTIAPSRVLTAEDVEILRYVSNHIALVIDYKRSAESLSESEIRFRSLVEQSADGIAIMDSQGILLEWNESLAEIVELPASQAIGRSFWELYSELKGRGSEPVENTDDFREKFINMVSRLNSEEPYIGEESLCFDDGSVRIFQVSVFFINYKNNVNIGAFVRDITSLKGI